MRRSPLRQIARSASLAFLPLVATSLLATGCGDEESTPAPDATADTGTSDTDAPEADAPEADAPEADAPESDAPTPDVGMDAAPDDTADTPVPDDTTAEPDTDDDAPAPDADDDVAPETCDAAARRARADELLIRVDEVATGEVTSEDLGDGVTQLIINASQGGPANTPFVSYVYVSLATGAKLDISDNEAAESTAWHIAFERANILTNGGDSGAGQILVARVEAADLDAVTAPAPTSEAWADDTFLDDACEPITFGRDDLLTAFNQWYDYDMSTHTVQPPANTAWVLYDASTRAAWKMVIDAWDAGTYTIRYAPLGR